MNFKLKTFPEVQWWSESRDFAVEDENNSTIYLRVTETPDGTSVKMFNEEEEKWEDATEDLTYWVNTELEVHELQLDFETREQSQLEKEQQKQLENQEQ